MFVNSGAEAVENGIKIARYYTGRDAVIAFEGAFHGRTLLGMTLTSKVLPYKTGFGPFAPEVYRIPYAYCYRCPVSDTYPGCGARCAELLTDAFEQYVEATTVAAVIIEPVLGEGGFVAAPPEYLRRIKQICEEHGIVFICDEIQTGMGRTGKYFAMEHCGHRARPVATAKSLGSGYPIAAVTGLAEIMDSPPPGAIGGTYGGNPVACAAALAVFDIIESGEAAGAGRGHRQAHARAHGGHAGQVPGGGRRPRPGRHDGHGTGRRPRHQAAGRRAGQRGAAAVRSSEGSSPCWPAPATT